jgi:group II intron reverse transcriptase/maturase
MMQVKKKKLRHHSLTGRITLEVMYDAYKNVKRNRGAAGIDKVSIGMYENNLDQNLTALMRKLKTDTYKSKPLRRKLIPKGDGRFRPLGIPAVQDRVAHEVIRTIINPIFEKLFHKSSHGFRRGRGCITAMKELLEYHKQGYKEVVDADIKGFFDNIPHKLIMAMIEREISDGKTLSTIKKFLMAGVIEDGKFVPTKSGTPQGGVISPLLANIVLNHLDWTLDEQGYKFVRYADDFVVLTKSHESAEKALCLVRKCIEEDLGLQLSPEKTRLTSFKEGFEFLGFFISSNTITMKDKAVRKFKDKIKEITKRHHNFERKVIEGINPIIRGIANYFIQDFTTGMQLFTRLDQWVRKRIRCMKYKRISRKDNPKLRNKHIKKAGLIFFRDLYLYKLKVWKLLPSSG